MIDPYRQSDPAPLAVGDEVEFTTADGFHLPYGKWRVNVVREDGWCKVANGWTDPAILRRVSPT